MCNKILLYIELPPPMHGVTYMNRIIYDSLKNKGDYIYIQFLFHLLFHLQKLILGSNHNHWYHQEINQVFQNICLTSLLVANYLDQGKTHIVLKHWLLI